MREANGIETRANNGLRLRKKKEKKKRGRGNGGIGQKSLSIPESCRGVSGRVKANLSKKCVRLN